MLLARFWFKLVEGIEAKIEELFHNTRLKTRASVTAFHRKK